MMTALTESLPTDADARRAITDDLDDTLVVEAAAGTGKTTELINRILSVLASGRATMRMRSISGRAESAMVCCSPVIPVRETR